MSSRQLAVISVLFAALAVSASASDLDEFKVKRRGPFAFAEKPAVTRKGDAVTIRFTSKGFCDATVAVEDAEGKIVRHLANGVLGENAPPPFQKGSLKQTLIWDGKDDAGHYIDDKDALSVRVSLGLRPRFERTLFWTPKKRHSGRPPILCATPEGVYVYDTGASIDHVRLFDHRGDYVRTVYPFPAGKIDQVKGLYRHRFPQDGKTLALKCNFLQTTMLTSGDNCSPVTYKPTSRTFESVVSKYPCHFGMSGRAATGMAVHKGKVALAYWRLNRFATDGSSSGLPVYGPKTGFPARLRSLHSFRGGTFDIGPRSLAFSPDGTWLYLAGYYWAQPWNNDGLHGVVRMPLAGDKPPTLFAGSMKQRDSGTDDRHFSYASAVACDRKGRVYVSDHMNDRIQVYSPQGKLLKTLRTSKPAQIAIHAQTGDIWVFSWMIGNDRLVRENGALYQKTRARIVIPAKVTHYGPLENPKQHAAYPLPVSGYNAAVRSSYGTVANGSQFRVALDSWTDPPTIWLVPGGGRGIQLLRVDGERLRVVRDFGDEVSKNRLASQAAAPIRQRLYANPATGMLYSTSGTSFNDVTRIDPKSGRIKPVALPFNSEEMAFDQAGRAYLRSMSYVTRYDARNWRELPWDYGEQRRRLSFSSLSGARAAAGISALPVFEGINWHMGGMHVSPKGHLAVACYVQDIEMRTRGAGSALQEGKSYTPRIYPGRVIGHKRALIHVWDRHGKPLIEDAVPGLPELYGVGIDNDDGIYVLSSGTRVLNGKRYYNDMTGTLMKFRPRRAKILAVDKAAPVPLRSGSRPKRPVDVTSAMQGRGWVEGEEWMYGGIGHFGKNRGVGCSCYNARFALDDFGRSFAPELDRYSVAVLDTNGNLILRVGRYGNVDDGRPSGSPSKNARKRSSGSTPGGPPNPQSIGGDQVALFHGAYVATHTDRRLFIADPGNARIVSVGLGYHATETIPLKNVPEGK